MMTTPTPPPAGPPRELNDKPMRDEFAAAEQTLRDLRLAVDHMLKTLNARIAPMRAALRNAGALPSTTLDQVRFIRTAPTPPSGHPPAPDPDTTIRLDPAAEAEDCGLSLDEVGPAEDSADWALHWWARLTFSDDFTDALGDGRGLHYVLSTADHLPNCVIKTVTPEQVRAFGVSLIELADRAVARRAPAPLVPDLAEVALGALAAAGRGEGDSEVQRPTLTALADVDFNADGLAVGRLAIAARVARDGWHEAKRWEDPLPVPVWVERLRAALGTDAECYCEPCRTSDARAARAAEYQRLLTGSLRAQCQTLGHVPADSSVCSRCGEELSRTAWSALVDAETTEEVAP